MFEDEGRAGRKDTQPRYQYAIEDMVPKSVPAPTRLQPRAIRTLAASADTGAFQSMLLRWPNGGQRRPGIKAHPHVLRRACGYALANKGHDTRAIQGWLGHRSITSAAVYTALALNRFTDFRRS
jgi:integrase